MKKEKKPYDVAKARKIASLIVIGLMLSVYALIFFGLGYSCSNSRKVTASADDISGYTDETIYNNYYIPLYDASTFLVAYRDSQDDYAVFTGRMRPLAGKYLILKNGIDGFAVGDYGTDLEDYTYQSLQEDYEPSAMLLDATYVHQSLGTFNFNYRIYCIQNAIVDWNSFSEYSLIGAEVKHAYYTQDYSSVYNQYRKNIWTITLHYALGADASQFVVLTLVPDTLYWGSTTYEQLSFYTPVSDVYTLRVPIYPNFYDLGYNEGYEKGFEDAPTEYLAQGYQRGYNQGVADGAGDNNTLRGVVTTMIETPVNMFREMTNWNFLGYNLFGIFTGLLTFVLILFIVKKLL